MNNVHKCNNCNTKWNTKKTYDLHASMCELIHKGPEAANDQLTIPSQIEMFYYILHLTNKYEDLEKKVAKIQSSTTRLRRKHIEEYLQNMQEPKMTYSIWLSSIEVADYHLQKVFEHDLEECIKQILTPLLSDLPIRAFTQKPSAFYIYDSAWRLMTAEEFASLVKSISHKVLRTYTNWSKEHHSEMHVNVKMQELSMLYMSKVNGLNHSIDTRISIIKKWLFSKIAVSLAHVDF